MANTVVCQKKDISCRGRIVMGSCLYHYRRDKYSKGIFRKFSENETDLIKQLYKNGMSTIEVAFELKSSVSAITKIIRDNNLTRPRTQKHWIGKKMPNHVGEAQRIRMTGKKHSIETRRKMSESHMLRLDGYIRKEPQNQLIRKSLYYKLWREAVQKRDDYTCQICLKRGGEINVDHIKPFSLYPELRFEVSNGRVLCVPCHRATPTYGANIAKLRMGVA